MPRVPPVTSATRPSSARVPVPAACGAAWAVVMLPLFSPLPRGGSLQESERSASQPAISGQMSVRALDPAMRPMWLPGRDVVRARGHDQQVLLDVAQVDALPAEAHGARDELVALVHRLDPLAVR